MTISGVSGSMPRISNSVADDSGNGASTSGANREGAAAPHKTLLSGLGRPPNPRFNTSAPSDARRGATAQLTLGAHLGSPQTASEPRSQLTQTNHATPKLRFTGEVHDEEFNSMFTELRKSLPWFPKSMREVEVEVRAGPTENYGRTTYDEDSYLHTGDPKIKIEVELDQTGHREDDLARALYYGFHEMADHALRFAERLSNNNKPLPEVVDHYKLFAPSDESNGWHQAIKSALKHIPDHLKSEFLGCYADDVDNHCVRDYKGHSDDEEEERFARHDTEILNAGADWSVRLRDMADKPNDPFWASNPVHTVRGDSSSGEEELGLESSSNPMKITPSDLEQAAAYETAMASRRTFTS